LMRFGQHPKPTIDDIPPARRAFGEAEDNDDRDWFESHPDRSYRLRSPSPEERTALAAGFRASARIRVVMKELRPGVRIRQPVRMVGPVLDTEQGVRRLFEQRTPSHVAKVWDDLTRLLPEMEPIT